MIEVPEGEAAKTLAVAEHCWDRLLAAGLDRTSTVLGARRRRGRRPGRLRGRHLHARHQLRHAADHRAGPGRRLDRRQDRHRPSQGQEPDRRVPPAAARHRRSRPWCAPCPSASSAPGSPRSSSTASCWSAPTSTSSSATRAPLLGRDLAVLERIIGGSCRLKASVIERDPEEKSELRFALNYGHTDRPRARGRHRLRALDPRRGGLARHRRRGAPGPATRHRRRRHRRAAGAPAGSARPAGARGGRSTSSAVAERDHPRQEGAGRPRALRAGAPARASSGRLRRAAGRGPRRHRGARVRDTTR